MIFLDFFIFSAAYLITITIANNTETVEPATPEPSKPVNCEEQYYTCMKHPIYCKIRYSLCKKSKSPVTEPNEPTPQPETTESSRVEPATPEPSKPVNCEEQYYTCMKHPIYCQIRYLLCKKSESPVTEPNEPTPQPETTEASRVEPATPEPAKPVNCEEQYYTCMKHPIYCQIRYSLCKKSKSPVTEPNEPTPQPKTTEASFATFNPLSCKFQYNQCLRQNLFLNCMNEYKRCIGSPVAKSSEPTPQPETKEASFATFVPSYCIKQYTQCVRETPFLSYVLLVKCVKPYQECKLVGGNTEPSVSNEPIYTQPSPPDVALTTPEPHTHCYNKASQCLNALIVWTEYVDRVIQHCHNELNYCLEG